MKRTGIAFRKSTWAFILGSWLISRVLIYWIGYLAYNLLPVNALPNLATEINPTVQGIWYGVLTRWDSNWYFYIANKGYTGILWAFLPLYPLSIRLFSSLAVDRTLALTIEQNILFLILLLLLYKVAKEEWKNKELAKNVVLAACFFPFSFFFSAPYTETLSILLILLSYFLAKRTHWLPAFLFAMLAGVTRITGCLVGIILLAEFYRQYQMKKVNGAKVVGFLLIPLGLVIYILFLKEKAGSPLAFLQAQKAWMRTPSLENLWFLKNPGTTLEMVFTLFYLGIVAYLVLIKRWAYALYTFMFIAIPLSTGTLMSMPRLGMNAFPVFLALGNIIDNSPIVKVLAIPVSSAFLAYFTVLFSLWYWVA